MIVWITIGVLYASGSVATFIMLGATVVLRQREGKPTEPNALIMLAMSIVWPPIIWTVIFSALADRK